MSFESPILLLGLVLVPLAIWAYVAFDAKRRRTRTALVSAPLAPAVVPKRAGARRHVGPVLYLLALTTLLVAIARPQAEATVKVEKASVMLVTDRSGSMKADDVAGGRMAAAKQAGNTFLSAVPDDVRTGLIAFSHEVQMLAAPTTDREAVRQQLASLQPGGSTAAGDALVRALQVLRPAGQTGKPAPGAIILLSDGESVRGQDPVAIAENAKKAGVKIYTVALGTDNGVLTSTNKDGTTRTQKVPPDRETLAQIAKVSGGQAFDAPDAASLEQVYKQLGSQVAKKREKQEVTTSFAGGALLLLVLGAGTSLALVGRLS